VSRVLGQFLRVSAGRRQLDALPSRVVSRKALFSPLFWILALLFFALFYAACRLRNNLLRVFLFWIPTLTVSVFCIAVVALYAYMFIRLSHP
jgi:hypothetical protein